MPITTTTTTNKKINNLIKKITLFRTEYYTHTHTRRICIILLSRLNFFSLSFVLSPSLPRWPRWPRPPPNIFRLLFFFLRRFPCVSFFFFTTFNFLFVCLVYYKFCSSFIGWNLGAFLIIIYIYIYIYIYATFIFLSLCFGFPFRYYSINLHR